ncbi:AraC family transcriptional regulator ligand-binding domain-containing protein [Paraburkholderia sp. SIMBA_030]|uniref:AraC family transcriptional regulator n=1 Tax=Paraburkholderia sp. SIMBA_030 TaxID=3085773 RepID=UPI00397BD9B5
MSTSCSHYFREAIRGAERCGLDGDWLIAEVGLARDDIYDPLWRGKSEQLARLVQLVWIGLNDEFMGFTERPCKTGTFAMMSHCILTEESLEQALVKSVLFYNLFTDEISLGLDTREDEIELKLILKRPELDPNHYFIEFLLSIWYRLVGWMGGISAPLRFATFAYPHPEEYFDELKYMFPCDYEFNAKYTALVFDRHHLKLPIVRTKEELKRFLSVAPLGFLTIPADVVSYSRRVRTFLLKERRLPLEFPEFGAVATQFNLTEQTLRRKLHQEGMSYRTIVENIRRDLAVQKLLRGRHPVSEIAELLGYSEARAFTRAFREWTGMSPIQYREHFIEKVSGKPSNKK